MSKVYLTKKFTFEAAHHLPNYEGKCSNVHGHSYKLEVTISGDVSRDDVCESIQSAMVLDFSDIKKIVNEVIKNYDHADLNTFFWYPTAEVMCVEIFKKLITDFANKGTKLEVVRLWETEDNYAEYRGE